MKRIVCIFTILAMILIMHAAGALTSGDFEYKLAEDGTATITRYLGAAAEPEIPDKLDGHPVTEIGENAFRDCHFLAKVRIPDGVTSLGPQAFYNCTELEDAELPTTLREIGDLAFAYCTSLTDVMILDGTERIGEFAFGGCSRLSIAAVPSSVIQIGSDAFFGMDTGLLSGVYGKEGSYAQEYAQANGIPFFPFQENGVSVSAGTEQETTDDMPQAADDLPLEATPGPIVKAEITVSFPHADRTGTYTGEMKDGLPNGKGTFTSTNDEGVSWTYDGEWEYGTMSGYGTLVWPSDSLEFRGYYRDNQPWQGEWLIDGTSVYTGDFRSCSDCGVYTFHGAGKLTNRFGRVIYEGAFDDGLLGETAQERQARAQTLDPVCEKLTAVEYTALLNTPDSGTGKLVRLDGLIGNVLRDEWHGWGELILLNNGDAACPVWINYRYGVDEERAQAGRSATVWGTLIGLARITDSRGREQVVLQMDADVIRLNDKPIQNGVSEVALTAAKVLDGRALKNREFTFALDETFTVMEERTNPLDGTVTFVPVTYTSRLQTKANDRDGAITFDPIRFTTDDIGGVFTYTVTEIPGIEAGMTYDPMVMTVTVIVMDDGNGQPAAAVFNPDDSTFNNVFLEQGTIDVGFTALGEASVSAGVTLEGRALKNGEFSFELSRDGVVLQTKRNGKDGSVSFDPISYTETDAGKTFDYMVRQVPGTEPGMSCDTSVKAVSVQVSLDGRQLKTDVTSPENVWFTNRYTQPDTSPVLSAVDADKTTMTAGDTVTFTPRVSGGVKPYRYHYVLFRDGAQIKDIGWLEDAARRSQLSTPGIVTMQVQVEDAQGKLSQSVLSTEVTVTEPVWTPEALEGTWTTTLTWSSYMNKGGTPPDLPMTYSVSMKIEMESDGTGTMRVAWSDFNESDVGTVTYVDGVFKVTVSNGYSTDYYEGTLTRKNGKMTITGSLYETQPEIDFYGSFTAEKME